MSHERSTSDDRQRAPPRNDSTQQASDRDTEQASRQSETGRESATREGGRAGVAPATQRPDPESVSVADLFPTTESGLESAVTTLEKADLPEIAQDVVDSPTQGLDPSIKTAIEENGAHPLGNVYIHTGGAAARAAEELGARAFTVDNHIVFNEGEYDLDTPEGKSLLAHELTAVERNDGSVSVLPKAAAVPTVDADRQEE